MLKDMTLQGKRSAAFTHESAWGTPLGVDPAAASRGVMLHVRAIAALMAPGRHRADHLHACAALRTALNASERICKAQSTLLGCSTADERPCRHSQWRRRFSQPYPR